MFKKLYNEATIAFDIETISPLFISSGEEDPLTPTTADNTYLTLYRDGKETPAIPGTSLKGVFRSRIEEKLRSIDENIYVCDILLRNSCGDKIKREEKEEKRKSGKGIRFDGKVKYEKSCAVCKLFGSGAIKSRLQFQDAFPIGEYKIGKRRSTAIDRVTGASKRNALFDFEYIEYGKFRGKIRLKNFFGWQLKLIFSVLEDINEGFVTIGGQTSKGFGRMKSSLQRVQVRYYDKSKLNDGYKDKGFYVQRVVEGEENIKTVMDSLVLNKDMIQRCELENDKAI